jgi:hypothetical protein
MYRNLLLSSVFILFLFSSCEKVITVDLNSADPAIVIEAEISIDSVATVHLTKTTSYFSTESAEFVEDAEILLNNGIQSETLTNKGNGYYRGKVIKGSEGSSYELKVTASGKTYSAASTLPQRSDIIYIHFTKSESTGILNPEGKTVFTLTSRFTDVSPGQNYYLVCYKSGVELLERYYLVTENSSNSGTVEYGNDKSIIFTESLFFDGGEVKMDLYSIDKSVYKYFMQLSDILFWKRRVIPPTPYNPRSNFSNGALGYFAAWSHDSEIVVLN